MRCLNLVGCADHWRSKRQSFYTLGIPSSDVASLYTKETLLYIRSSRLLAIIYYRRFAVAWLAIVLCSKQVVAGKMPLYLRSSPFSSCSYVLLTVDWALLGCWKLSSVAIYQVAGYYRATEANLKVYSIGKAKSYLPYHIWQNFSTDPFSRSDLGNLSTPRLHIRVRSKKLLSSENAENSNETTHPTKSSHTALIVSPSSSKAWSALQVRRASTEKIFTI